MPLTKTGRKVMASMRAKYGARAEEVFHASINKGVPGSAKWHRSPDEYDDTGLGETPARRAYKREQETGSQPMGRAVGQPAAVVRTDGVENLRAEPQTKAAGDGRKKSSANKRRQPVAVDSYNDAEV